jgi:hypothetical protein
MRFEAAGSELHSGIQEGCASKKLYTIETSFRVACCGWWLRRTNGGVGLWVASHLKSGVPNLRERSEAVSREMPLGAPRG